MKVAAVKHNGELYFFDFEYSGKDDLCKIAIDLSIQPDKPQDIIYTAKMIQMYPKITPK